MKEVSIVVIDVMHNEFHHIHLNKQVCTFICVPYQLFSIAAKFGNSHTIW